MEYTLLLVILVFFLAGPCLSLPAQVIAYESLYVLFILIKPHILKHLFCRFPLNRILEQEDKGEATRVYCIVLYDHFLL